MIFNFFKALFSKKLQSPLVSQDSQPIDVQPKVIPRGDHNISRTSISKNALKVLYQLKDAGYEAYLVGGAVRDLLLNSEPKDFDLATNAHPDEIRSLFRNCRLIGRRFRLAHVHFRDEILEVATFRALHAPNQPDGEDQDQDLHIENGRILRDNVYGTREEDALRRDFTVNALYYDIRDFSIIDYVQGMDDIRAKVLRLIGDPVTRYKEDPVRMLRAVRFIIKQDFTIDPETERPLRELNYLLAEIPPARLFEEVLKTFLGGAARRNYDLLRHYGLFTYLFPETDRCLSHGDAEYFQRFVTQALINTDERIAQDKPVTPAFLYAALLWKPYQLKHQRYLEDEGLWESEASRKAANDVIQLQLKSTSLPKRFSIPMREIWELQPRFLVRHGKRSALFLEHPRFRAAYDFMLLRNQAGEPLQELADWWTQIQVVEGAEQSKLWEQPKPAARRRRRTKRKPKSAGPEAGG